MISEDDNGAQKELNYLSGKPSNVVFRIRRGGDEASWVTEIVCILFNAQGTPLEVIRGNHSNGNIQLSHSKSKDSIEKGQLSFSLKQIQPAVEVIGLLITYSEDKITGCSSLNEFALSCELFQHGIEEGYHHNPSYQLFQQYHRPEAKDLTESKGKNSMRTLNKNAFVSCKLYRDRKMRSEWIVHNIATVCSIQSSVKPVLIETMQMHLLDIIPDIDIPNKKSLNTVQAICEAISCQAFLGIEQYFPEHGVRKDEFARIILYNLLFIRPDLLSLRVGSTLVALLSEMFEQIDINGDALVDWNEFTTFCISVGLMATKEPMVNGAPLHLYTQQPLSTHDRYFPYQISRIKIFNQISRIAVIENKSSVILMYDTDLSIRHEVTCVAKQASKEDNFYILDVDYIPVKNLLAVSSSDHSITLWSIVNLTSGAYVLATRLSNRYPIIDIRWCTAIHKLLVVSSEWAKFWDVEAQTMDTVPSFHKGRITDLIDLPNTPYFATCSYDHEIAVWDSKTVTVAFSLRGHSQAVLHLDYSQNVLLSCGFEHQAYCWSITNRSILTTLAGHHHSLIGAKRITSRTNSGAFLCVTGDSSGHFKLWDISRCAKGYSTDPAMLVQSFEIHTTSTCNFHTFSCGPPPVESGESDANDIICGNLHLFRFRAVAPTEDAHPPRHVVFNAVSNTFVGAVDGCVTVWNSNSGTKVEEPITLRDAEICAMAFDVPRERKLFVATSDGAIRMHNPITGVLMTKVEIHDGIISSLVFCPRTSCLISTGYDRNIVVSFCSAGKSEIEVLRTVESAHEYCITACAFSPEQDLIATGDDSGFIHVYDFQKLYLRFKCEGHQEEMRALHFHPATSVLIAGDAAGIIHIWQARGAHTTSKALIRLSSGVLEDNSLPTAGVTAICSTKESAYGTSTICASFEDGTIRVWDFHSISNLATKGGYGCHFEPLFQDDHVYNKSGYNPLLRVNHKSSVLKLRNHFDQVVAHTGNELEIPAFFYWKAHDQTISTIAAIPSPAFLYSTSTDCTIRVWDTKAKCLGMISTLKNSRKHHAPDLDRQPSNEAENTVGKNVETSWKYSRHLMADASLSHSRLASQVIRKFKQEQNGKWYADSQQTRTYVSEVEEEWNAKEKSHLNRTNDRRSDLDKVVPGSLLQRAFASTSLRSGVQQGLFGPEEAKKLKQCASKPYFITSYDKNKPHQALLLSHDELEVFAKKTTAFTPGKEHERGVMRTMTNFPLEMEKRSIQKNGQLAHLDVSPSKFLRERLREDELGVSPTKNRQRRVKMCLDANVIVVRNVSLPSLNSVLTSSSGTALLPSTVNPAEAGTRVNTSSINPNVERKMKLYESMLQEEQEENALLPRKGKD